MRIGSLFSGAGGLDMAVEAVFGGEVIWNAEIDKAASKVLAHRFPGVPNLGDITQIDWKTVEPVDVLCGGFPCQDVSAAGKRAGIKDGTRSGLWAVFADAIDALRPRYVVIENVRGLLSATAHRDMESGDAVVGDRSDRPVLRAIGAVLGDLCDLGYDAQWSTVSAASVGAPHRRERVFIVATDAGYGRESEWAWQAGREAGERFSVGGVAGCGSEDAAVSGDAAGVALLPTPGTSDTNGAGHDGDGGMDLRTTVTLLPTPTTQDGANNSGPSQFQRNTLPLNAEVMLLPTPNASDGSGGGQHPDKREGHSRQLIDYVLLCTPSASDGAGGKTSRSGGRIDEPLLGGQAREMASAWGKYEPAIRCWERIVGPAPAPTEPNKNGNPRLSAAFSEWLMGWPAGWVTNPAIGISRNDQLRIVGNGVVTQQAIAALRYLLAVAQ